MREGCSFGNECLVIVKLDFFAFVLYCEHAIKGHVLICLSCALHVCCCSAIIHLYCLFLVQKRYSYLEMRRHETHAMIAKHEHCFHQNLIGWIERKGRDIVIKSAIIIVIYHLICITNMFIQSRL